MEYNVCKDEASLYFGDEKIAEFVPEVRSRTVLLSANISETTGEHERLKTILNIDFTYIRHGESCSISEELDIKRLSKTKFYELHPDLYAISDSAVANYIISQVREADVHYKYMFDTMGWNEIQGRHVFVAGDGLIGDLGDLEYEITNDLKKLYFRIDEGISEDQAVRAMWDIMVCLLEHNHWLLVLVVIYIIASYDRQLLKDAGYMVKMVMYMAAASMSGKTTFTTTFGCPLQTSNGALCNYTRVSSTAAAVESDIEKYKDMPFIYDDLYRDDRSIMKKIEEHVKQILRSHADGVVRNKKGGGHDINANLMLIGEYLINGISNIGRMLIIQLDSKIDSRILTLIEYHKDDIMAFSYYYIKWLASNYSGLVEWIKHEIKEYRYQYRDGGNISRDYDKALYVQLITEMLFKFFLDKLFVKSNPELPNKAIWAKDIVMQGWKKLLESNYELLEKKRQEDAIAKNPNYSKILYDLMQNETVKVGKKGSDFFKKAYKGHKCYYIRSQYFCSLIIEHTGMAVSPKALVEYFRIRDIAIFGSDDRVVQYKGNKKRYLVLKKAKLKADAETNT